MPSRAWRSPAPADLFADFVTNNAADNSTANGSGSAAAGQNGTADRTDTSTHGRVLALP